MKEFIRKRRLTLIFTLIGAIGGFLYWRFVGCLSGTCPIKSVWYWSTLWGTAVGYLAGDIIQDFARKRKERANAEHE
ncbi:MAG: hypothetical protein GX792_00505 [Bacteroidales bacterium]|nr:hypothetical protein [Bacteroidales bacterium]